MLSFFVALMLLSTCDMAHEHMRSTVASLRVSSRKEFDSPQCPNPGTALREQTPLFTERQNVLRLRGGYRDSDVLRHYVLVMSKADEGEDLDRLHIAFDAAKQAIPPPDTAENNEEAQTGAENSGRDANVRLEGPSEGGSEQGDSQMSVSSAQGTGVGDNSPSPAREPVQSSPQHSQMSAAQLAHRIGVVLFDVKQNASGAEFYWREALRLDPTHVDAAADYACLVHRVHRDADKAERLYEHVLTRAPGHVATLCNAAWLFYTHKDNAERAESYLRLALSTEPYHPDALHMVRYAS